MRKNIVLWSCIAAFACVIASCGDDKDEKKEKHPDNWVDPTEVFTGKRIAKMLEGEGTDMYSTAEYDANGFLTKVSSDGIQYAFTYLPLTRIGMQVGEVTIVGTATDPDLKDGEVSLSLVIGANGFCKQMTTPNAVVSYAYNADGMLVENKSVGHGVNFSGTETVTYQYENGDLVKTVITHQEGAVTNEAVLTYFYTNSEHPTSIDNKGALMPYGILLAMESRMIGLCYYAGLLGKSMKHLPVSASLALPGAPEPIRIPINYVLDKDGYPTKVKTDNETFDYSLGFTWK
ncbi:MAG: DUF4595 domain-containing protein [Mediterranea sp.]|jgi:hypothetical protein|nr:DUF4595 domain-containing protein [Mediterranea sp.]